MPTLLAVDLGLHCGLALFGEDGRLRWYRSRHFGSSGQLRSAVEPILSGCPELTWVFAEGSALWARVWSRAAAARGVSFRGLAAEDWRPGLLLPRDRRSGQVAKQRALTLARQVVVWSGLSRPQAMRHDTAEAILVGLWGVIQVGWLERLPQLR